MKIYPIGQTPITNRNSKKNRNRFGFGKTNRSAPSLLYTAIASAAIFATETQAQYGVETRMSAEEWKMELASSEANFRHEDFQFLYWSYVSTLVA